MTDNSQFVSPVKRIAATIYDFFLLLGVWFGCGSIALWINNGEILHPVAGASIVIISAWLFYSFFWIRGGKTLGMTAWSIQIYSTNGKKVNFTQATIRFYTNILIFLLAGLPLLQIYISKNNMAINDNLSGTNLKLV